MKRLLLLVMFFCFYIHKNVAQYYNKINIDTFYYPFDKGIQMIEIVSNSNIYDAKYDITYIFRNEAGEILKTFNADKKDIAINQLKPTTKEYYTDSFLLYQYQLGSYKNKKETNHLFMYRDSNELYGLINQYGENMLPAAYINFRYYQKHDLLLATERGNMTKSNYISIGHKERIFYLNNMNKKAKPLTKSISADYITVVEYTDVYRAKFNQLEFIIDIHSKKILFSCFDCNNIIGDMNVSFHTKKRPIFFTKKAKEEIRLQIFNKSKIK